MRAFSKVKSKKLTSRLSIFLIPYGFIYIADSILAYLFPLQLESHLENKALIGIVITFAAIGSILMDYILPILGGILGEKFGFESMYTIFSTRTFSVSCINYSKTL